MNKSSKSFSKKRKRSDSNEASGKEENSSISDLDYKRDKISTKSDKKINKKNKSDDEDDNKDIIVGRDEITFILNKKKRLNVRKFKGQVLVDIREFWNDDNGDWKPSKKGISLTLENWDKVKLFVSDIDDAIKNMK